MAYVRVGTLEFFQHFLSNQCLVPPFLWQDTLFQKFEGAVGSILDTILIFVYALGTEE
jgi:hypothetical protein